jgi:hypothetical protein
MVGYVRGIFGNYASLLQKSQHIINDKGRGTCFTIRQIYNAISSVLPRATLHIINFSDDYLCNQADFTNTEGKDLNTINDCFEKVMNGEKFLSEEQIAKVEHLRVIYYTSFFKDAIKQGYKGFICLVYGANPAKKLLPLIKEAYAKAIKDCEITEQEFELIVTNISPHFRSVIHDDITEDTLKAMDDSLTVLINDPSLICNYFQDNNFELVRRYYSTSKKDRISAILEFLCKYKDRHTNATTINITLNDSIPYMSAIIRRSYYENHKDSIVEYANDNKSEGDATDYDENNIHIQHLAQYFAWTGIRARAEKHAAILEFLSDFKDLHTNATSTTITLNDSIPYMSAIICSYYEEEKASIVEYANDNKSEGDMTDYDENNIHIQHLDMYYTTRALRARTEKRAAILEFLSDFKDLHTNATSTTITLNDSIPYMSAIVRSYYEEEKASIVIYANVSRSEGDMTDYNENNIHIQHLDMYYTTRVLRAGLASNDKQRITRIYQYVIIRNGSPVFFAKSVSTKSSNSRYYENSIRYRYGQDVNATTENINSAESEGGYKYYNFEHIRLHNTASWLEEVMAEESGALRGKSDC